MFIIKILNILNRNIFYIGL